MTGFGYHCHNHIKDDQYADTGQKSFFGQGHPALTAHEAHSLRTAQRSVMMPQTGRTMSGRVFKKLIIDFPHDGSLCFFGKKHFIFVK